MPKKRQGKIPAKLVSDLIPTDSEGRVDEDKLALIERVLSFEKQELEKRERERRRPPVQKIVSHLGDVMHSKPKITPDEEALKKQRDQKEKEAQERDIYLNAYRYYLEQQRKKKSRGKRAKIDNERKKEEVTQVVGGPQRLATGSKRVNKVRRRPIVSGANTRGKRQDWSTVTTNVPPKKEKVSSAVSNNDRPRDVREKKRAANHPSHFHQKQRVSSKAKSSQTRSFSEEKSFPSKHSEKQKQKFSGANFSQLTEQKRRALLARQLKASTLKFNRQLSSDQEPPYLVKITPDKLPAQKKNYQETPDIYEGVLADAPWLQEKDPEKKNTYWQESQIFDFEKPLLVGEVKNDKPKIIPLEERDGYWQDFLGKDFSQEKEREINKKMAEEGIFLVDPSHQEGDFLARQKEGQGGQIMAEEREGLKIEDVDYELEGELIENPQFEDKVSRLADFLGPQVSDQEAGGVKAELEGGVGKSVSKKDQKEVAEKLELRKGAKEDDSLVQAVGSTEKSKEKKKAKRKKKKNNSPAISHGEGGVEKGGWTRIFKPALGFAGASLAILGTISLGIWASYGFQFQEEVKVKGSQVVNHLEEAKSALEAQDFASVDQNFQQALEEFEQMQADLDKMGGDTLDLFSNLPYLSKVGSGKAVIEVGNELTEAGQEISKIIAILVELEDIKSEEGEVDTSLLTYYSRTWGHVEKIRQSLERANQYAEKVKIEDLPEEYQDKFVKIKEFLPEFLVLANSLERNHQIFLELLGANGPRKYMLVFQNNQEMRATGGFIGSYGILSVSDGKIKDFFIDGIFGPDWQLKEDVIPPKPIQKISAGWSTHDANWFPHFPKSAEKIAWFYEKTGGPTIDGVITLTPNVMEKLLQITGPIRMEEYDVTITADNFVEKTQYEVEVDYDKEENEPKKILADLAPVVLEKIFATKDLERLAKVADSMSSALEERHIMFYSTDPEIQAAIAEQGWAGEVLETDKDYLMVVNSNINGYKTDGVIDEEIYHTVEVQSDGSLVATTKIKRSHQGGNTPYEWWNKVNANYMRVYVPEDSELLEASGHTRETVEDPLNYQVLEFKTDPDVVAQESSMKMDEETGTRIYKENNKTVFANWVYVSPQETVEVEYKYKLPFQLDFDQNEEGIASYSLLAQKQSGSEGSKLIFELEYGSKQGVVWQHPQVMESSSRKIQLEEVLDTDQFVGVILQNE